MSSKKAASDIQPFQHLCNILKSIGEFKSHDNKLVGGIYYLCHILLDFLPLWRNRLKIYIS